MTAHHNVLINYIDTSRSMMCSDTTMVLCTHPATNNMDYDMICDVPAVRGNLVEVYRRGMRGDGDRVSIRLSNQDGCDSTRSYLTPVLCGNNGVDDVGCTEILCDRTTCPATFVHYNVDHIKTCAPH